MGTLYIVSTPIGNLDDITIRAIKTLFSCDIIACEDTRRTGILLTEITKRFGTMIPTIGTKRPQLIRYDERSEEKNLPQLIRALEQGKHIALVSDSGTPLISDPGFTLVREARKRKINVVSIPGPSALLVALTSSGLPTDTFFFLGYPPEKKSHRIDLFRNLLQMNRFIDSTYILFCSPHKLQQTLHVMKETLGDITIVVARELTKRHEEIWRGNISSAMSLFAQPKGEFVILLSSETLRLSQL